MAQFAIMRFAKHKGGTAGRLEAHHERTKEQYASNPDIDTSKSKYNFHIMQPESRYKQEIDGRITAAVKYAPNTTRAGQGPTKNHEKRAKARQEKNAVAGGKKARKNKSFKTSTSPTKRSSKEAALCVPK